MPKRTIGPSHFAMTGRLPSVKNGTSRNAESSLEQDFLLLLEFDNEVAKYGVQPITISWKTSEGKIRNYTPDVLVLYQTDIGAALPLYPPTLYEVKPRRLLIAEWHVLRPKYKAAMNWARMNDLRFKLITDEQIRTPYLQNVRFLTRFSTRNAIKREGLDHERHVNLREALRILDTSTPRKLLNYVTSDKALQLELIPMIWQMMHIGVISADLCKPLNMSTPIWLRRKNSL